MKLCSEEEKEETVAEKIKEIHADGLDVAGMLKEPVVEERKIVSVNLGGIKLAIGRVFKTHAVSSVTESDLVRIMSFDNKWVSPNRARDIIFTAEKKELLKREADTLIPLFDLNSIPDTDVDYSYLQKDSALEQLAQKTTTSTTVKTPPKRKPILWSSKRKNCDRCKRCKALNTPKCDDCVEFSNEATEQ